MFIIENLLEFIRFLDKKKVGKNMRALKTDLDYIKLQ
jgi:hypothetical protein